LKILATSGVGVFGSNFVKKQLKGKPLGISEIIVLDKLTYTGNMKIFNKDEREPFGFIQGDICDLDVTEAIINKVGRIVNFTSESHVDRSLINASSFVRSNVLGPQAQLENGRRHGIEKLVQVPMNKFY
jgi:dTDP-glucose 4,6-dehydratase